ncbi:MAG: diguanylate cyclase [Campylobacter sp.]|nr:diguanylate cyclase [Campylobacter sp.]
MIQTNEEQNVSEIDADENEITIDPATEENTIYEFSENVLKELSNNNIPSIPSNYSIYFDRMLEERSSNFKEKLENELTFYEQGAACSLDDGHVYIEKEIKQSFAQIKSMLQAVALVYKNLKLMTNIINTHKSNLKKGSDLLTIQNTLSAFNEDLSKLNSLMDKHVDVIRINYEEVLKMFNLIKEQAVYDSVYDVYNKKFLLNTLQLEYDAVRRYGYKCSFLIVKPSEKLLLNVKNLRDKSTLLKTMSKILMHKSRRSDTVGHYGEGYFMIIMRHTSVESAKLASTRLSKMFLKTKITINEHEKEISTQIVGGILDKDKTVEETLSDALDLFKSSNYSEEPMFLE